MTTPRTPTPGGRLPAILSLLAFAALAAPAPAGDAVRPSATLLTDVFHNASGGLRRGTRELYKLSAGLEGSRGGLAWKANGHATNAGRFSEELVGDSQTVSNLEAPSGARVDELWINGNVLGTGWLLGVYDLNTEFDAIGPAGLFLDSSHGIGPDFSHSGQAGPSIFPYSALGLRALWQWESHSLRAVVLDGVPGDPDHPHANTVRLDRHEGALGALEWNCDITAGLRYALGLWRYSEPLDRLDGQGTSPAQGAYTFLEFAPEESPWQGWLRFGRANGRVQDVSHYLGAGLTRRIRAVDLGLALGQACSSADFRAGLAEPADHEDVWEATATYTVNAHLGLQLDWQHVRHPGFDASLQAADILGLRVILSLGGE